MQVCEQLSALNESVSDNPTYLRKKPGPEILLQDIRHLLTDAFGSDADMPMHHGYEIFCLEYELGTFPEGSISHKKRGKYDYYYWQFQIEGVRKQRKIKKDDVPRALAFHRHKQELKQRLRALRAGLQELPVEQRREERAIRRLLRQLFPFCQAAVLQKSNTYVDGSPRDSKNELILSLIYKMLGLSAEPSPKHISRSGRLYRSDYLVSQTYIHEHMGMLYDPQYYNKQIEKLRDYAGIGLRLGRNLLVTTDDSYKDSGDRDFLVMPKIMLQMVLGNVVKATRMRRLVRTFLSKRKSCAPHGFLDNGLSLDYS